MTTVADHGPTPVDQARRFPHLLPALFFTLLVLALNYPLTLSLGTHVASNPYDDTFEVIWQLATVERAVFESHTNPFFTPDVFFPHGWYLASGAQPTWYYVLPVSYTHLTLPTNREV